MTANMTDATSEVPLRVSDPQLIPAARYYDEAFFKLENEKLWPHVWQMACRLEEIPNIGDYTEYANLGKSVLRGGARGRASCPSRRRGRS